MQITVEYEMMY